MTKINPPAERAGLRSAYIEHQPVHCPVGEYSMTRQEMANECDINVLMKKYETQGVFPQPPGPPQYLDLTQLPFDYQDAQNQIIAANEAFMRLPADARRSFDNDPGKFCDYAEDPANLEQMRSWGLAPPAPTPPPEKKEVAGDPPSPI